MKMMDRDWVSIWLGSGSDGLCSSGFRSKRWIWENGRSEILMSKSSDDRRNTAIDLRISCSHNQLMQI